MALGTVPRFSIVVPCHASRAWLRPCLDSVLGQSFTDFEVIGVDDADPDGSRPDPGRVRRRGSAGPGPAPGRERRPRAGPERRPEGVPRRVRAVPGRGRRLFAGLAGGDLGPDRRHHDPPVSRTSCCSTTSGSSGTAGWSATSGTTRSPGRAPGVFTAAERPVFLTFLEVVWNKAYRRDFLTLHGFVFTRRVLRGRALDLLDDADRGADRHAGPGRRALPAAPDRRQHPRHPRPAGSSTSSTSTTGCTRSSPSDPELAGWRRFAFDRSLDHILAVLAKPERIDPDDRAEFFHAAARLRQALEARGVRRRPDRAAGSGAGC